MIQVSWHPHAVRELFEASDFYESESNGLGSIFLETVENALERLRTYPLATTKLQGNQRKLVLPRFPYSIVLHLRGSQLRVLAVAHHKRRPRYWRRRR
ncbi:MAG: type II toxin-antitoxin system RelE/ParE family toxin [Acidobacteria bacterium]|nr:type II toxin-antitoxin system RelE/ParE family toxin [Acidobacteriota bacterium]